MTNIIKNIKHTVKPKDSTTRTSGGNGSATISDTYFDGRYVKIKGDTMTGLLTNEVGVKTEYLQIGDLMLNYDETNHAIKVSDVNSTDDEPIVANFYATGGVSARGIGVSTSGGGTTYTVKTSSDLESNPSTSDDATVIYDAYAVQKAYDAAKNSMSGITVTTSGSGNVVTNVEKSGTTTIAATKGISVYNKSEIDTKVNTINTNITSLQSSASTNASNIKSNDTDIANLQSSAKTANSNISTLQSYFTNGVANSADTLDGYHAKGLLTGFANDGNKLKVTVGGTSKSVTPNYAVNADKLDGYHFTDLESRYVNVSGDTMTGLLTNNVGIQIGSARLTYDTTNNALKVADASGGTVNFYATGGVSARGIGSTSGGGGGTAYTIQTSKDLVNNPLTEDDNTVLYNGYAVQTIADRVTSLEGGSATKVSNSGTGNVVTALSKSGTTITATKDLSVYSKTEIDSKVSTINTSINSVASSAKTNASNIATNTSSINTLKGYFTNGVANNADKLDGYHASSFSLTSHTHSYITSSGNLTAITGTTFHDSGLRMYQVYNNGYPTTYGNLLTLGGAGQGELLCGWAGSTANGGLYYRSKRDTSDTAWSSWKTVAFTDSTVSNADTVDGYHFSDLQSTFDGRYVNVDGDTMSGLLYSQGGTLSTGSGLPFGAYGDNKWGGIFTSNGVGFRPNSSGNDGGWVRVNEDTVNNGWIEIASGDDGSEPIYARQYNTSGTIVRSATLLDGSGNTSFPNTVTAPTFSGYLNGTASNADTVDGYHFSDLESRYVNVDGDTMNGTLVFANNVGIRGYMGGGTDFWALYGTGSDDNGKAYLEWADNTDDEFIFRHTCYDGSYKDITLCWGGITAPNDITSENGHINVGASGGLYCMHIGYQTIWQDGEENMYFQVDNSDLYFHFNSSIISTGGITARSSSDLRLKNNLGSEDYASKLLALGDILSTILQRRVGTDIGTIRSTLDLHIKRSRKYCQRFAVKRKTAMAISTISVQT